MHNPINDVQKRMIQEIDSDDFELPRSKHELRELIVSIMVAVDHEANERQFMDKCVSRAARTYFTLSKRTGKAVYISSIKNQMANTNYFRTLRSMAAARGVDAMRLVCSKMVTDGYAVIESGKKIKMTSKAYRFLGGEL